MGLEEVRGLDESVWENAFHLKQRFRSHCGVSLEVTQGGRGLGRRKQSLQGTGGFDLHLLTALDVSPEVLGRSAGEGQGARWRGVPERLLLGPEPPRS